MKIESYVSPKKNKPEENSSEKPMAGNFEKTMLSRRDFLFGFAVTALSATAITQEPRKVTSIIEAIGKFFRRKNYAENKEGLTEKKYDASEIKNEKYETIDLEKLNARELADKMIEISHEIYDKKGFLPEDLVNDHLVDAIELRESGGSIKNVRNPEPLENKGAFGVMQLREAATRDIIEKLHRLVDYREINPHSNLQSTAKLEKIKKIIKESPRHGRAFGAIYVAMLYKIYGIGKEEYEAGDREKALKKIITAYKEGPTLIKKKPNFIKTKPAKDYHERPERHLNFLKEISDGIEAMHFKTDKRKLARHLTLEIDRFKTKEDDEIRKKLIMDYLKKIKKMENRIGRGLENHEIMSAIEALNPGGIRFDASLRAKKNPKS
ncbi:MAG: hypothetical protein PHH24_00670 [Candidatus Moranbacteria bacterium]|jgi:hypothetical protein|nr:hypothetical protein [Candidatus Moranbacteria bacterium]MDX9855774.1 hypothetical protein [Candidatus Moranbacteria bacterium]